MKKMFTLLFALGSFALVQAQPAYRDNRQTDQRSYNNGYTNGSSNFYNNNYDNDKRRYDNDNFSFDKQRMIDRINHEYHEKIERVQHNIFLGWREKQRRISMLQEQREQEIRMVYARYHDRDDHFGDKDRRDRW
jgi:hypothetical protein